jgi:hypothetical protein
MQGAHVMDFERLKQIMDDQLLTAASAARLRGVDARTIRVWFEKGWLKATLKTHDGRPLFRRGDVLLVSPPRRGRRTGAPRASDPVSDAGPDAEKTNQ